MTTITYTRTGHLYKIHSLDTHTVFEDRDIFRKKDAVKLSKKAGWTVEKVVKYCNDNGYSGFCDWDKNYFIRPKSKTFDIMTAKLNERRFGHCPIGVWGKKINFILVNPVKPDRTLLNIKIKEMQDFINNLHLKLGDLVIEDGDSDYEDYEDYKEDEDSDEDSDESAEELEVIYI